MQKVLIHDKIANVKRGTLYREQYRFFSWEREREVERLRTALAARDADLARVERLRAQDAQEVTATAMTGTPTQRPPHQPRHITLFDRLVIGCIEPKFCRDSHV